MPPSSSGAGRRPSPWALILLLALLQSVTPLSVDLYLPALPTIARALHTRQGPLNLTLSAFMIGFAVGQLIWGPVGDRFGRKGPMILGLALYVAASAGCALSTMCGRWSDGALFRRWAAAPCRCWARPWCATASSGKRARRCAR